MGHYHLTQDDFIRKAKQKHGDRYDYSLVEYKKSCLKVLIVCKEHGVFEQKASTHLLGHGCPICGKKILDRGEWKKGIRKIDSDGKRKCPRCKESFPRTLEYFSRHRSNSDGLCYYCRKCAKGIRDKWKIDHPESFKKSQAKRNRRAKETGYRRNYYQKRRDNDMNFNIENDLRNKMWVALKRSYSTKSGCFLELTGCTIKELNRWLSSQFQEGMTWENHGRYGWHIDHIKPCASFDLSDPEQQRLCFHYTNLQPLWAEDNYKKGSTHNGVRHRKVSSKTVVEIIG